MTNAILRGMPDVGNLHVRFDEGGVASAKPRRGSLLYNSKMSLMIGLCVVAVSAFAAEVSVGYRQRGEIRVPTGGSATQSDRVTVVGGGNVYKTGGGDLTLPLSVVRQGDDFEIGVLDGSVTITDGTAVPAKASAPVCLQNEAAVWFAADKNVVTTNGAGFISGECVSAWYDYRATDANDAKYYRMAPVWWIASDKVTTGKTTTVPPCVSSQQGETGVYFGGAGSGQSMLVKKPTDAMDDAAKYAMVSNVLHAFVVYGYSNSWSSALGTYHPTGSSPSRHFIALDKNTFFQKAGAWSMVSGNFFLDGVWRNAFAEKPADYPGMHLMECEVTDMPGHFEALMRDSTLNSAYAARNGGDFLYEVIAFTNRLTSAERVAVQNYLMDKWNLTKAQTAKPVVDLYKGGSAKVSETLPFMPKGEGLLVKEGSGRLDAYVGDGNTFDGSIDIQGGSVAMRAPMGVKVADGDSVDVESLGYGEVTKKTSGDAGTFTKTGRGRLRVEGFADSVKAITVKDGVLRLAPSAGDATQVDTLSGGLQDPSFESFDSPSTVWADSGRKLASDKTYLGEWYYEQMSGAYSTGLAAYWHEPCKYKFAGWSAPDGIIAMYVKGSGMKATTTVTPRTDGVYEFSFMVAARSGYVKPDQINHLDFYIGESDNDMEKFGSLEKADSPYVRYYYRTPRLTGGKTYKLRIQTKAIGIDGTTTIDDLRFDLVPDAERKAATVVKVPYGDFEDTLWTTSTFSSVEFPRSGKNQVRGWELTTDGSWSGAKEPPVSIVYQAMSDYTRSKLPGSGSVYSADKYSYPVCQLGGNGGTGFAQLHFASTGGIARTTTPFYPPAGRYRLRADISWMMHGYEGLTLNGNIGPRLRISRDGGDTWAAIGTVNLPYGDAGMRPVLWEQVVDVKEGDDLRIMLEQNAANGKGSFNIDNLELVKLSDPEIGNLLKNGSFEENDKMGQTPDLSYTTVISNWTVKANTPAGAPSGFTSTVAADHHLRVSAGYSTNVVDGTHRIAIRGLGSIYQSVYLDKGYYQVRFFAESRHDDIRNKGMTPIQVYLTRSGEPTNFVGQTWCDSSNYVEHAFIFRNDVAAYWNLTLQGMSGPEDGLDRRAFVDCVSLVKLPDSAVAETATLAEDAVIKVANGARLELDFTGTNTVKRVKLGGHSVIGVVNAKTHPEFISGLGSLKATEQPGGLIIIK